MTLQKQIIAWVVILGVLGLFVWLFRGILLPFVAGMVIAYLLNPTVGWLERARIPRGVASLGLVSVVALFIIGAILVVVPMAVQQMIGLAERLPGYVGQLQGLFNRWAPEIYAWLGEERMQEIQNAINEFLRLSFGQIGTITAQIMASTATIINTIALAVVTPVIAFYLLLDWERMTTAFDRLLPRQHRSEIKVVMGEVDRAMSGVIRGQGGVILLLMLFYATSLTLVGLNYGMGIGIMAGLFSFVPYVGFVAGFVLSMAVALVQFWPDWVMVVAVLAIFLIGQFIEGNILYPKLVGESIGIRPVWLMFALFAFGVLFGFTGFLMAVPLAALTGVLVRFGVHKYEASPLYLGPTAPPEEAPEPEPGPPLPKASAPKASAAKTPARRRSRVAPAK